MQPKNKKSKRRKEEAIQFVLDKGETLTKPKWYKGKFSLLMDVFKKMIIRRELVILGRLFIS